MRYKKNKTIGDLTLKEVYKRCSDSNGKCLDGCLLHGQCASIFGMSCPILTFDKTALSHELTEEAYKNDTNE